MGIRERIQREPALIGGISAVILLVAGGVIYHQTLGQPRQNVRLLNSAFYSDDDGNTWFIDDASKLPPFDHNGKQAVRAVVYRYDDNKKFVAYLERFSDAQLAKIQAAIAVHPEEASHWLQSPMQVKKPGDAKWVSPPSADKPQQSILYDKITMPTVGPDGSKNLSPVSPTDADAMNQ